MALTGAADGPPVVAPGDLAGCARGAIDALAMLAGDRWRAPIDGAALFGERAAISGLSRRGTISPGGACRLLPTARGWIAINLPRDDDLASVPAWLGEPVRGDPWHFIAERVARRPARTLVRRARLLGMAAAESIPPPQHVRRWCRFARCTPPVRRPPGRPPLVVDLSSLWAGPLATHLLGLADRIRLRTLVASADIVVESARPRALAQLGIYAREIVARVPGMTWVGITGYGRVGRGANWIAFGDDAAVAAGLATATGAATGTPLFCADAIADPLAGMYAAVAALASWQRGGGQLVDIALRDVVSHALDWGPRGFDSPVQVREQSPGGWDVVAGGERQRVAPPRARRPPCQARPLGADTDTVLRSLAA